MRGGEWVRGSGRGPRKWWFQSRKSIWEVTGASKKGRFGYISCWRTVRVEERSYVDKMMKGSEWMR